MNDTTRSSQRPGSARKPIEDKPDLHKGKHLCYYFKRDHTYIKDQVEAGNITFDTALEIDVEHCVADRPAMSLRASFAEGSQYNRYQGNFSQLVEAVENKLAVDELTGDKMWNVKVTANDKAALGPAPVDPKLRRPRLGSFEVTLSWKSPGAGGGKHQAVLFSKLNTQRFPMSTDLVGILVKILSPARSTRFQFVIRDVPSGKPEKGAYIQAEDHIGNVWPNNSGDQISIGGNSTNAHGFVDLLLPFGVFHGTVRNGGARKLEEGDNQEEGPMGMAKFEVHGILASKALCIPLVQPVEPGSIRVVLSWSQFPHDIALVVKTPEGLIRTPVQSAKRNEDGTPVAPKALPNAEFECIQEEGGYGPISVLLKRLLPGRYHIFARCEMYPLGGQELGWNESNAQLTMYGAEQDMFQWAGPTFFNVKKEENVGNWWDVCFLEVSEQLTVTVREFCQLTSDEPGNRHMCLTARDLEGNLVPSAKITCQPEAEAYASFGQLGTTNDDGTYEPMLALGDYTASIQAEGYLVCSVKFTVDLEPHSNEVTLPLVKKEYFMESTDYLVVLSWGGDADAKLVVETPGRLLKDRAGSWEDPVSQPMMMRGINPKATLLTAPDPLVCMEGLEDKVFVKYNAIGATPMEKANMQLSFFSKDAMEFSIAPKKPLEGGECPYWKVCKVKDGSKIEPIDERTSENPATGGIFSIKVLPAKSDNEMPPAAELIVTKSVPGGPGDQIRKFLDPPTDSSPAEYTTDGEYSLFLEYGTYIFEAKDEKWHSPCILENVLWSAKTQPSASLALAAQGDLDAKTAFITLGWAAGKPEEIDLCIKGADGTVVANSQEGKKAPAIKGVKVENMASNGPKVISLAQPISGNFRVYVQNKNAVDVNLAAANCNVTIILYTGIWRNFQLKLPSADVLSQRPAEVPYWHVCNLKIESDSKMGDQCIECQEINKLDNKEPVLDPS